MTEPTNDNDPRGIDVRSAAIGALMLLAMIGVGFGISQLGKDDSSGLTDSANPAIATSIVTVPVIVTVPITVKVPVTVPATTTIAATTVAPTTSAPVTTSPPTTVLANPCLPGPVPSKGIIESGIITLSGDIPTEEDGIRLVDLSAQILGADNVVNNYRVCDDAGDPSEGNIIVNDAVLFASGSAIIADEFTPLLGQGIALMTIRPSVTMEVVGHTDSVGSDELNQSLSELRAQAVVDYITANGGIDPSRFAAIGKGPTEPIDNNETAEGREANRRIEVFLKNLFSDEEPG